MSVWTVNLSWDDGTPQSIDLDNYNGEDLLLEEGFRKNETIHKDLKPTQDQAQFAITWKTSLANTLLTLDADTNVTVTITKDAAAWFYGYLRPVTSWEVREVTEGSVVSFEALDHGWRLKRPTTSVYSGTNKTVSTIVTELLVRAGYGGAFYNVPTISNVIPFIFEEPNKKDIWDILSALLFSYNRTFYFDAAGVFQVYDWSVDAAPSIAGVLNDTNIISTLKVERKSTVDIPGLGQFAESDGTVVEYETVKSVTNEQIGWTSVPDGSGDLTVETVRVRFMLDDEYSRIISVSNLRLRASYEALGFSVTAASSWRKRTQEFDIPKTELSFGAVEDATYDGDLFGVDVDYFSGAIYRNLKIGITGDVEYTVGGAEANTNTDANDPEKIKGTYLFSFADANRLATILDIRRNASQYRYTASSETDFDVGDYVTLQNVALNIDTTARVTKRSEVAKRKTIFDYELEGVQELSALYAQVTGGAYSITKPSASLSAGAEAANAGLSANGDVIKAISGNLLDTIDPAADETGLYFDSTTIGLVDGAVEDWVFRVYNDGGVGKMKVGTGAKYMEWDGADLNITGAANIGGKITAGDGIESVDFVTSTTGWRISGDGDAEFNAVDVRGNIDAETGTIGAWVIDDPILRDTNNRIRLNPTAQRLEIRDALDTTKIALGYLGEIESFEATQYGLYIAPGNAVLIEGDVTYSDGDFGISGDAALVVRSSVGTELGRFGSFGGGDIGFRIGTGVGFGDLLGGGGAAGTFGTLYGGGGAAGNFSDLIGGGPSGGTGIRYSIAEGSLTLRGTIRAEELYLYELPTAATGLNRGRVWVDTETSTLKVVQ